MSIIDKLQKNIKSFYRSSWIDELFWFLLLIFVALSSFAFGVRYERERFLDEHPVSFHQQTHMKEVWESYIKNQKTSARFFASKNGSVFYPLGCPLGKRINENNRVFFKTKEEARAAGYKPSSRCF